MNRAAAACASLVMLLLLWPGGAEAQSGASLQLALDKPVALSVTDAPIGEVFRRLTAETGVKFVIGPDVYACLPYGEQTRLAVKLKNVTLRNALSPMLAPQAMEWILEKGAVRIVPTAALLRMTRRATYEELGVLGRIHAVKMQPTAAAGSVIEQLRKATGATDLNLFFHVQDADKAAAIQRAERALPAAAAAWLDMLCHGRGWTWYLWGDNIAIVDKKAQIGRQLRKHVSLKYENARLVTVLLDLAKKARVALNMDPGVMSLVPAQTRSNFNLAMTDATIAQALEVISGATGLVFVREAEGIRVDASEQLKLRAAATTPAGASKRSPFFLKKAIRLPDGSTIELLIRPDDLPEDVLEAVKAERAKLFELLTRKYRTATQPATTRPAK